MNERERERARTDSTGREDAGDDGFVSRESRDEVGSSPGAHGVPDDGMDSGTGQGGGRSTGAESGAGNGTGGGAPRSGTDGGGKGKVLAGIAAAVTLAAAALFAFSPGASDDLSDQEASSRTEQYRALAATPGGLPLSFVDAGDVDRAIAEMPESVSEEQRTELRADVDAGRVNLAWLTLWDTHQEDGDVLRFESANSFPIEVTALNAKTTIAIPYPTDGSVLVTGVHDGGGGITVALESGAAQIAWPSMAPGDTLSLPVSPGL